MYMIERVIKKSIKENTYLLGMKYVFNFRLLPNTYGGRAWIYDRESVNAQKDLYNFVKKSKRRKEYPCTFLYIILFIQVSWAISQYHKNTKILYSQDTSSCSY